MKKALRVVLLLVVIFSFSPLTSMAAMQVSNDSAALHKRPRMVFNNSGTTGVAAWEERSDIGSSRILYAIYTSGILQMEGELAVNASSVSVATNGSTFMAIYDRDHSIYARLYNGSSWEAEKLLETSASSCQFPQVASNGAGYAAIWQQGSGSPWSLAANIYSSGAWKTATLLENKTDHVSQIDIASNGTGYAVAFIQNDGLYNSVYANIYNGSAWQKDGSGNPAPTPLETSSVPASYTAIASDGKGYAVVWDQYLSPTGSIYVNIYNGVDWQKSGGIASPTLVSSQTGKIWSTDIASDGTGYGIVWSQQNAITSSYLHAQSSIYSGGVWSAATLIEADASFNSWNPHIASNGTGYAATWDHEGYIYTPSTVWSKNIYANIYMDGSWGTAAPIETGSGKAEDSWICRKGADYAAVWSQIDNQERSSIFTSIYGAGWSAEQSLVREQYHGTSITPKMASNADATMAVWTQYNNGVPYVYASVNRAGSWSTPEILSFDPYLQYPYPAIATDGTTFMVTYSRNRRIYARLYDGSAWVPEMRIDNANYSLWHPQIASNGTGYAITWEQENGSVQDIYANIYTNGAWGTPTVIETGTGIAYTPQIASNGSGYAVTWRQGSSTLTDIYANVYENGSWSTETLLETRTGTATAPLIASDGKGYAVAWKQATSSNNDIWVNMYTNGNWGTSMLLQSSTYTDEPMITSNGAGYGVVWGYGNIKIYSEGAWSSLIKLKTSTVASPNALQIASNGRSYGFVWRQYDGSQYSIYWNSYNGTSWGTAALLETNVTVSDQPFICSNGVNYSAVWRQVSPVDSLVAEIWAKVGF